MAGEGGEVRLVVGSPRRVADLSAPGSHRQVSFCRASTRWAKQPPYSWRRARKLVEGIVESEAPDAGSY